MRISTLDPISLNDVTDLDNAPYLIDGEGPNALKIYFKTRQTWRNSWPFRCMPPCRRPMPSG
jgi:hypothetical protein